MKNPWEMSWREWVRYYEAPARGYGSHYVFAKKVGDVLGIESNGGDPGGDGINYRERWYKAIIRWALAGGKDVSAEAIARWPELTNHSSKKEAPADTQ